MHYTAKFQTQFGEIDIPNIELIDAGTNRRPHINNELGQKNHNIEPISILRTVSLQQGGKNKTETDLVKLAAATGERAYFKGTIHIAAPSAPDTVVRTLSWDRGHIIGFHTAINGNGMTESIQIALTNLKIDDSKFELAPTT